LLAILRLVIERVIVDGQSYQIHYGQEVRPYFTQEVTVHFLVLSA
jgi:hypothetical protein